MLTTPEALVDFNIVYRKYVHTNLILPHHDDMSCIKLHETQKARDYGDPQTIVKLYTYICIICQHILYIYYPISNRKV